MSSIAAAGRINSSSQVTGLTRKTDRIMQNKNKEQQRNNRNTQIFDLEPEPLLAKQWVDQL